MKQIKAHINPLMIKWAREKRGFDIISASKKINNVKPEKLKAWEDENNPELPTINQAMKMAEVYKRPLSLFYLDELPRDFSVKTTDFRRHIDNGLFNPSPALLWEKRYAEMRHQIALELAESEEADQALPKRISIDPNSDPVLIAQKIRNWLGITWDIQRKWKNSNKALNAWKEAIENKEFLVFHTKHYNPIDEAEVKGFALNFSRFPVIVLNVKEDSPNAPIFTLMHELTHLLLNTGGFCDCWEHRSAKTPEHQKEVFCNRIAGEVLVPKEFLLNHDLLKVPRKKDEWFDDEINLLSRQFVTSKDVIVRRLLILGIVSREFYEKKHELYTEAYLKNRAKKKEEKVEEDDISFPPHFRTLLKWNGKLLTRIVLSAYHDKKITLSDVSDYLGTKTKHIPKLESVVFST